ncbi:MAG TPA: coenzyme F420-0:L-glutamate ligase [Patescibacteria group bacterium]|nr:coenzyme F420-0:L-glutamate ligase [Patescibacteria group bacterium]
MNVVPIRTHKITVDDHDLLKIIDRYITDISEGSILVVTSKIVSLCEGNVVAIGEIEKDELIEKEADLYLPKNESKYHLYLTIKDNILAVSAGVDESNTGGYYVLWPKNAQETANRIREHLVSKFNLKKIGVIISDSKTTPLRWGVTGVPIAWSGFAALADLIGTPDIFGRNLKMTKVGVMDGLTVAAVLVMGESSNQTPLCIVTDVPFVEFQDRNPTEEEIHDLKISIEDDVYAPLLESAAWKKKRE